MKKMIKPKRKVSISAEGWSEQLWDGLASKIAGIKSKEKIKYVLERLISEDERGMMLKRLAIISLIHSGKTYNEISEILWLSPNTISTVRKNLIGNHKNYKSYRAFYGGPTQWSTSNYRPEKSYVDAFMEIMAVAGKIFEPFLYKGIGVLGDRNFDKYRRG